MIICVTNLIDLLNLKLKQISSKTNEDMEKTNLELRITYPINSLTYNLLNTYNAF